MPRQDWLEREKVGLFERDALGSLLSFRNWRVGKKQHGATLLWLFGPRRLIPFGACTTRSQLLQTHNSRNGTVSRSLCGASSLVQYLTNLQSLLSTTCFARNMYVWSIVDFYLDTSSQWQDGRINAPSSRHRQPASLHSRTDSPARPRRAVAP